MKACSSTPKSRPASSKYRRHLKLRVVALLAVWMLAACTPAVITTPLSNSPDRRIPAAPNKPSPESPSQAKIDSDLLKVLAAYLAGENVSDVAALYGVRLTGQNEILVDVYVNGPATDASTQLQAAGMQVLAENEAVRVVEGVIPLDRLLQIADLQVTRAIQPVSPTH